MKPSFSLHAPSALLPVGWRENVRVVVGDDGKIATVACNVTPEPEDRVLSGRVLLPAPTNAHSHAFQRGLAGRTQRRAAGADSFWSWRDLMYRVVETLTPDALEAITAQAYVEMCEAGYAAVAEFHYLHHAPDGAYADVAEMSARVARAASTSGIGLTLLPVLYAAGGVDGRPPTAAQQRFACDESRYAALWQGASAVVEGGSPDWRIGIAPHSLRAVPKEVLQQLAGAYPRVPVHIHIAEQQAEVRDVETAYGATPVKWLCENLPVDERWSLVHATHIDDCEAAMIADSGSTVVLCPVTEADLGDGIFPADSLLARGGRIAIGTDSNVAISLADEMRILEYGQRLASQQRNVVSTPRGSTGRRLFELVINGGAKAAGRDSGRIAPGALADLLTLRTGELALHGLKEDAVLDGWIFSSPGSVVGEVWSAGRLTVEGGRHRQRYTVSARYRAVLEQLFSV